MKKCKCIKKFVYTKELITLEGDDYYFEDVCWSSLMKKIYMDDNYFFIYNFKKYFIEIEEEEIEWEDITDEFELWKK